METMKTVLDTLFSDYMEFIDNEASRLLNVKPKIPVVYITAAFHDLGKIIPAYQQQLRIRCTAPCHEVLSATLILSVENIFSEKGEELIYIFPVIAHHHVVRTLKDLQAKCNEYVHRIIMKTNEIPVDYLAEFTEIARKVFGLDIKFARLDRRILERNYVRILKLIERVTEIRRNLGYNHEAYLKLLKIYKLTSLVLFPLAVADIIAASVNRACKGLSIHEILKISYRNPMVRDALKYKMQKIILRNASNKLLVK